MPYPIKLLNGKAWNATPSGENRTKFGVHRHNRLDNGEWREVSKAATEEGDGFYFRGLPFDARAPKTAGNPLVIDANSATDDLVKEIMTDPSLVAEVIPRNVNDVPGVLESFSVGQEANAVRYPGAYSFPGGNDGDLLYLPLRGRNVRFQKLAVFHQPLTQDLELEYEIRFDREVDLFNRVTKRADLGITGWDKSGVASSTDGANVVTRGASQYRSLDVRKFTIWDSSEDPKRESITVTLEHLGGEVYLQKKIIPASFFTDDVVYPVYADTEFDADTGGGGVDGQVENDGFTWATIHDATAGNAADDSSATMDCWCEEALGSTYYDIRRLAYVCDTASIPDGDTVSAGHLDFYVNSKADGTSDGTVRVIQSSPASNTALATGDFDQFGSTDNPTAGSSDVTIASLTASAYNQIDLNSTGYGWASVTGHTTLGLREATYDCTDTAIAASNVDRIRVATSEDTTFENYPNLDLTHAAGGGGLDMAVAGHHYKSLRSGSCSG